ncbi:MAG: EAL domain-containing protein [Pseudomonadota bacterium]
MRFGFLKKLLVLTLLPLMVVQAGTMFFAMRTAEREVTASARQTLAVGAEVTKETLRSRDASLLQSIKLLSADFALREVMATSDAASIRSALDNHAARVESDFAAYVEVDGAAFTSTSTVAPQLLRQLQIDLQADDEIPSASIAHFADRTYQLYSSPLRAPTLIGYLVFAFEINNELATRIHDLTGLDVSILSMQAERIQLVASTERSDADVARVPVSALVDQRYQPGVVYTAGPRSQEILLVYVPVIPGDSTTAVSLKRSMRAAMAPFRASRSEVLLYGIGMLVCVALLGIWFSSTVSKPLRSLTAASERMASGDYEVAIEASSRDEIATLAKSFNRMQSAISEREASIRHQNTHNSLTGLPNQTKAARDLGAILKEQPTHCAIISIILMRMGKISSTIGQTLTEDLLCETAEYLKVHLPTGGLLAHTGTHEFVLIMPGVDVEAGERIAETIGKQLNAGITLGSSSIILQSHIGVSAFPDHGDDAEALLRGALVARSDSQVSGRLANTYELGREALFERQLQLVGDIPRAIHDGEIMAFYQPKVAVESGRFLGAEALVRWEHREFGFLSPAEFIPAAEEAGAITKLTRKMIELTVSDVAAWKPEHPNICLAVNLSTRDLMDDRLISFTERALKKHAVSGRHLVFEVTESAVMDDVDMAHRVLSRLRNLGIRIAIDDFGTGHSSLAQLKHLPLDQLKIDRSFVANLADNQQDEFIVSTTIDLAHRLNLSVVAEGIENEASMRRLAELGCDSAQGYFLSKPLARDHFVRWVRDYQPTPRTRRPDLILSPRYDPDPARLGS